MPERGNDKVLGVQNMFWTPKALSLTNSNNPPYAKMQ